MTPVLPQIVDVFGISRQHVALLVTFFTLPGVFLGLLFGILTDRIGRRQILVPSLLLFGVAGVLCGFAPNFSVMLFFRFLQGIGGAVLGTISVTILGDNFRGHDLVKAMGYNSSVLSVATASYPALGGILASVHWRLPFFLPALAVIVAVWVIVSLKSPEPEKKEQLKGYLKNALSGVFNLRLGFIFGLGFLTFMLLYGPYLSFLPLYTAERYHTSPLLIGMLFSVASISSAFTSSRLGFISKRLSQRTILLISFILYTVTFFGISICNCIEVMFLPVIAFGIAQGLNLPTVQNIVASAAPLEYRGAFMSFNTTIFRLGQTLGPLLAALVYSNSSMKGVFRAGGVLSFIVFISLLIFGSVISKGKKETTA